MRPPRIMLVLDLAHLALGRAAAGRPDVFVQLRDRQACTRELVTAARALVEAGIAVLVNDRADVCRVTSARGVHLPESGLPVDEARSLAGPGALIGVSVHQGLGDWSARARGADYALFGPVFATPGKGEGVGLAALSTAVAQAPCPLLAIGGIDPGTARSALDAGAVGVAALRAADQLDALERCFA